LLNKDEEKIAHKSQNMICLPYESFQHFQQFHQYQQQQQQPQQHHLVANANNSVVSTGATLVNSNQQQQQQPSINEQPPTTTLQQPLQERQPLEKSGDQSINVEEFQSLVASMKELKQQQTLCGLNGRFGLNIESFFDINFITS
jgi:hypothetical protein